MIRSLRSVALVVVLTVLAGACGDDDVDTTSPPVEPAGEEPSGTVTLLAHDSFSVSDDVLARFESESGLEVEIVTGGDAGSVVNQSVLTAGDPVADVLYGVDNTFLSRAFDGEIFEPYASPELTSVPAEFDVDPQDRVTPIDYGDVCLNYDRDFFSADVAPPSSLDDLIDPAYSDMTVVEDPALSSPGLAFLLATISEYGDGWTEYWEALSANGVRVAPDWESAYYTDFTVGGGGDRPIVVSYASSPPADVVFASEPKDEPSIGVVQDSCFRQIEFAGVLDGASNPEGARRLIDFMLSDDFQSDMPLNMFVFPVSDTATLPDVFVEFAAVADQPYEMDFEAIGAQRDAWIQEWTELVVG